jgi:hypothetical protein
VEHEAVEQAVFGGNTCMSTLVRQWHKHFQQESWEIVCTHKARVRRTSVGTLAESVKLVSASYAVELTQLAIYAYTLSCVIYT